MHHNKMAYEKIFEDLKRRNLTKIGTISGTDGFVASVRAATSQVKY